MSKKNSKKISEKAEASAVAETPVPSPATPHSLTPAEVEPRPCASFICGSGHIWPLTLQVAGCPGCQGPTLAIEAQLCPICNEPFSEAEVRIDITTSLIGIPATCRSQAGRALTAIVKIPYSAWGDWQVLRYARPEIQSLEGGKLYDSYRKEELPATPTEPSA